VSLRLTKSALTPKPSLSSASTRNVSSQKPSVAQIAPKRTVGPSTVDRFETRGAGQTRPGNRPVGIVPDRRADRFDTGTVRPGTNLNGVPYTRWGELANGPAFPQRRPGTDPSGIPDTNWDQLGDGKTKKKPVQPLFDHRTRESTASDGYLVGENGGAYPPGTRPGDVDAVEPSNGEGEGTVIFVNGQGTQPGAFADNLQELADATGANVVGVYNATEGTLKDTAQSLSDKKDEGTNPAVETTADLVYEQITHGEDVRLVGHSQGALIVSRALEDVRQRLLSEGKSEAEVNKLLGQVHVETLGGAASTYPDGPHYTHYINRADIVPRELGLGETAPPAFDLSPNVLGVHTHPGAGATVVEFDDGTQEERNNPGGNDHSLSTYLEHYSRPEDVASHPDRVEELPDAQEYAESREEAAEEFVEDVITNPVGTLVDVAGDVLDVIF